MRSRPFKPMAWLHSFVPNNLVRCSLNSGASMCRFDGFPHEGDIHLALVVAQDSLRDFHGNALDAERIHHYKGGCQPGLLFVQLIEYVRHP